MKIDFKKLAPYLAAFGIIMIVILIMFQPALDGKTLQQEDVTHWKAASKEALDYYKTSGEQAYWSNTMFSGMPTYMITIKHVGNLFLTVDKFFTLFLPFFMGYVFLGFAGFFFLSKTLKINTWVSIAGALAFALSSYFIVILAVGHNSKAHAIAYMAPFLISVYMTYRGKYLLGGLLAAFILALELACNHVQITYYLAFTTLILVIFEAVWAVTDKQIMRFLKASGLLIVGVILAVGVNFSTLYTTWEYSKETIRGKSELTNKDDAKGKGLDKSYIYGWSYGVGETWTLLIPNAKGGASQAIKEENKDKLKEIKNADMQVQAQIRSIVGDSSQYWGEQPGTSGPVYAGAIVMFFFVLGCLISTQRLRWPLLVAGLFSVLLSWGGNFTALSDFFVDYMPMYNKFRTPSMWLVVAELVIPFMFVLALHELLTRPDKWKKHLIMMYIAFGLTGGIAFLFYLMPTSFFDFISGAEQQEFDKIVAGGYPAEQMSLITGALSDVRIAIFKADALRSFLFVLGAGLMAFLFLKKKIKAPLFIGVIIALVAIDMIPVDKRYLKESNFISKRKAEKPFVVSPADQAILDDNKDGARVLNMAVSTFMDATTSYYHRSVGGYSAAKLMRYQELIEKQIAPEMSELAAAINGNGTMGKIDSTLSGLGTLNMLNTRYIILDPAKKPLPNRHALGHCWFVNSYTLVENADQEIKKLGEINPANEAVVDKRFAEVLGKLTIQPDSGAAIARTSISSNEVVYQSKSKTPQLAVFSEIYYPEWELYIDGKKADLIRADYVLRAALIPAGEHKIEMRTQPTTFKTSTKVSLASSVLLLLLAAGYVAKVILDKRKASRKESAA